MSPGEIAIYYDHDPLAWSPRDDNVGGAETAAVAVATCLARTGHTVSVYGNLREPQEHEGARYRPRGEFDPAEARLAVISRVPDIFDDRPNAETTMLWNHAPDAGAAFTPERAAHVDHVLALSRWHARWLAERHPFAAARIRQIRNGIEPADFVKSRPREPRVVFSSQPERGLDVLLEIWPDVIALVPSAELAFCYAAAYEHAAGRVDWVADHRRLIATLAEQPGVRALGPLGRGELIELLTSSRVWAHPSWSTPAGRPFFETSCIGAMEAQAAGLCVVASAFGALPETVRVGTLVPGDDAPGPRWRRALTEAIVSGLTDAAVQHAAQRDGPRYAAGLGWDGAAAAISALLTGPAGD